MQISVCGKGRKLTLFPTDVTGNGLVYNGIMKSRLALKVGKSYESERSELLTPLLLC